MRHELKSSGEGEGGEGIGSIVGNMMRTRRLHERLAYVVRVDDRASVAHVAATLGVRVKSGRAVHRCMRSACRSRRCVGLCIVVVAAVAAAADAVLSS
jgi:hypothetical protein